MNERTQPEVKLWQQVERLRWADDREVEAVHAALAAAGEAGMAAVIQGLSHPNLRVRRECADFMDHQGTDSGVAPLLRVARHDPRASVRRVAIHSLGCQRCKVTPLRADLVAPLIESALSDESLRVRKQAVLRLGQQPLDPRAAAALQTMLGRETDRKLLTLAHRALMRHDEAHRQSIIEQAKARVSTVSEPAGAEPL